MVSVICVSARFPLPCRWATGNKRTHLTAGSCPKKYCMKVPLRNTPLFPHYHCTRGAPRGGIGQLRAVATAPRVFGLWEYKLHGIGMARRLPA